MGSATSTPVGAAGPGKARLDPLLQAKQTLPGRSRVVVRAAGPEALQAVVAFAQAHGGRALLSLPIVDGVTLDLPNAALPGMAEHPLVAGVSMDREVVSAMDPTAATIGALALRQQLGYTGAGVGVAVIDSGVSASHDDLLDTATGASRVTRFVDFVNRRATPYDDNGHGTHVTGIIGGNGFDSGGGRSGIAPGVHLVVLKVLDAAGRGRISDVIAALDYVVANKDALNIRLVNVSVASNVYESHDSDPLTLAAKRAVSAGIVVVAAAGNNGRSRMGARQYAGITAPGNAPWVLTVGASSHMGTIDRKDDTIAAFSSRGPSAIDYAAKPDLVAPGVGIESLSDPGSLLYLARSSYLLDGTVPTAYQPYMSLSGTSMSAAVVTGTVALMFQANPSLTPNAVKAVLQYTAQSAHGYDALTQGAGFVNAKGAVELAAYLVAPASAKAPIRTGWSKHIIWGSEEVSGGELTAGGTAWSLDVNWGATSTATGEPVSWGENKKNLWWAGVPGPSRNVVWKRPCQGPTCGIWTTREVVGASDAEADTVVWGTSDAESDTVVWGTGCKDPSCEPVIWKRP